MNPSLPHSPSEPFARSSSGYPEIHSRSTVSWSGTFARTRKTNLRSTAANSPFEDFFDQLRDLYSMEVQLSESMPHWISLCTNEDLGDLLVCHSHQSRNQIAEIAAIFKRYGESPGNAKSQAVAGLTEGGAIHLEGVHSPHIRDLMMIAHCLRVEYYEIAAYEFTTLLSGRLGVLREPLILIELLADEKEMAGALMQLEPDLFETANS